LIFTKKTQEGKKNNFRQKGRTNEEKLQGKGKAREGKKRGS
jgi:hypothetical protein